MSADGNSTTGSGWFRIDPVGPKGITVPRVDYTTSAVGITAWAHSEGADWWRWRSALTAASR